MVLALIVAGAKLFSLQVPQAAGLRAQAASQLKVTDVEKAVRGNIVERNLDKLAYTTEARALTFQPAKIRKQLAEAKQKSSDAPDDQRLNEIAKAVSASSTEPPTSRPCSRSCVATRPSSTSPVRWTPRSPRRSPRSFRRSAPNARTCTSTGRLAGRQRGRRDPQKNR